MILSDSVQHPTVRKIFSSGLDLRCCRGEERARKNVSDGLILITIPPTTIRHFCPSLTILYRFKIFPINLSKILIYFVREEALTFSNIPPQRSKYWQVFLCIFKKYFKDLWEDSYIFPVTCLFYTNESTLYTLLCTFFCTWKASLLFMDS